MKRVVPWALASMRKVSHGVHNIAYSMDLGKVGVDPPYRWSAVGIASITRGKLQQCPGAVGTDLLTWISDFVAERLNRHHTD